MLLQRAEQTASPVCKPGCICNSESDVMDFTQSEQLEYNGAEMVRPDSRYIIWQLLLTVCSVFNYKQYARYIILFLPLSSSYPAGGTRA